MMIFLSILFFVINLSTIFRGPLFSETSRKLKLLGIEQIQSNESIEKRNEAYLKAGCLPLIGALTYIIFEITFLVNAFNYDLSKCPTLFIVMILALSFVVGFSKKNINKMNKEELSAAKFKILNTKKVTFKSIIRGLIWTTYYGYMTYILVF
ncbi:hypothetical protein ACFVQB_14135 [Paenibacillus sp. NPDC057886]|uniref:hypothetical protein n=1 Tax=Paenibacillus sp. NPDC057886 TaxID=3346270 RepID=UPI0036CB452E